MLLKGFRKIETFFPPCHPGEVEKVTAVAELTDDISEVFPYLNAILKGTIYTQKIKSSLSGRIKKELLFILKRSWLQDAEIPGRQENILRN